VLTLPRSLTLTPAQFAEVCAANPEAVLELDADGTVIEMTPTGGSTSTRNTRLLMRLQLLPDRQGGWRVFDSSGGFRLPDGSVRRPDASLVRLDRWRALSDAERDGFPSLCPDLVVELASPSDDPEQAAVVSTPARVLADGQRLEAGKEFPGLTIDLAEIWEA
jgi:Uma2 family endonuclease